MSKVVKPLASLALTAVGAAIGTLVLGPGIGTAIGAAAGGGAASAAGLNKASVPKASLSNLDRLTASLVPSAPRKMAFGRTAFATDIRYVEPSGTNQDYVDYIIHVASHRVCSIDEIWFEDKLAWSGGAVQSAYAGYLTVSTILEGGASAYHTVNGGSHWGAAQRLTGCASVHLRIKRTGNSKKAESPLVGGLPGRLTIVGNGMPLYHPAFDSTVPGGSGTMRIADQSTWAASYGEYDLLNNPALQSLAANRGWRINGVVSVGLGMAAERLDLPAFATTAAICDEAVALAAGGSQRRYETAGLFSDFDDPRTIQAAFADATSGWFDDSSGKLGLFVAVNDLAGALPAFGDDDVLSAFKWKPFPDSPLNVVRGRNPDPAAPSLYQLTDYPEVSITAVDGIDRPLPLDLGMVQDKPRAQRIAKIALQRQQYQGLFSATFGVRAWQLRRGQPIRFSFAALGWSNLTFRVVSWRVNADATVDMDLRIENAAIYAWDRDETAAVTPATPVSYDPLNAPLILAAAEAGQTADWDQVVGAARPADYATRNDDAGNLIPAPVTLDQATFANGAFLEITAGSAGRTADRYRALLVYGLNSLVVWCDYIPCRPNEPVFYRHTVKGNLAIADGCRAGISFRRADGSPVTGGDGAGNFDLPSTAVQMSSVNGTFTDVAAEIVTPPDAFEMRPYAIRNDWNPGVGGTFFVGEPWLAYTQAGATRTAPAGSWTGGKTYRPGDIVTYGGASWIALDAHVANVAIPPPNTHFQLLAAQGDPGAAGAPAIGFVQDGSPGPGAFVSQTWYRPSFKTWYRWDGGSWQQILGALSSQDLIADSAYLANAVIIRAKIGDLEVDSAKIANLTIGTSKAAYNAFSESPFIDFTGAGGTGPHTGSWFDVATLSVSFAEATDTAMIYCNSVLQLQVTQAGSSPGLRSLVLNARMFRNGAPFIQQRAIGANQADEDHDAVYVEADVNFMRADAPGVGTFTYQLQAQGVDVTTSGGARTGTWLAIDGSMTAVKLKR